MLNPSNVLIFSLLGGVVPALFWLWFWIREDRLKPEPRSALLLAFLGGSLAVFFALFFELIAHYIFVDASMPIGDKSPSLFWMPLQHLVERYQLVDWQLSIWDPIQNYVSNLNFFTDKNINVKNFVLIVIFAPIIEEVLKFIFTYTICLNRKANDEPIDASIYMLTGALGFAAVETALFLTAPISKGDIIGSLIAGNFRSIGPMLIHLVCSAMLGIFIGLAFYKNRLKKTLYFLIGLVMAIVFHSLFNFFIILNESTKNIDFFWLATIETWLLVFVLLVFFRQVKKVTRPTFRRHGIIRPIYGKN